jgi:hypothetical protein
LSAVRGRVQLGDGIKATLTLTAKDGEAADGLLNDIKAGLGVVLETLDESAKVYKPLAALVDLLKKLEPVRDKATIELKLDIPAAVLGKLLPEKS